MLWRSRGTQPEFSGVPVCSTTDRLGHRRNARRGCHTANGAGVMILHEAFEPGRNSRGFVKARKDIVGSQEAFTRRTAPYASGAAGGSVGCAREKNTPGRYEHRLQRHDVALSPSWSQHHETRAFSWRSLVGSPFRPWCVGPPGATNLPTSHGGTATAATPTPFAPALLYGCPLGTCTDRRRVGARH